MLFDLAAKEKKDIFVEENRLAKKCHSPWLVQAKVEGLFVGEELQGMRLKKETWETGSPIFL